MKRGTKSLLFGVHQFAIHPIVVGLAWIKCYHRLPRWHEAVAIVVHDWGYWGCSDMDGREGKLHPIRGAAIADWIAGEKAGRLALCHSISLSRVLDAEPSALYLPDKVSILFEPRWFYWLRAKLSGEIDEYALNAPGVFHGRPWAWLNWYRERVRAKLASYRREQ